MNNQINRRTFFKLIGAGSLGAVLSPEILDSAILKTTHCAKPKTNVEDALKYARNENSMPGKYPGKVVQVSNENLSKENIIIQTAVDNSIEMGMLKLTGESSINTAWLKFVSPKDIIGLKVNPVAGKDLSTSLEIVRAIISQLENAGISKKNIIIWDRREFELNEVGFNDDNFKGIKITGTEQKDKNGSFYNSEKKLYGENNIDKEWFYWADCEDKYDDETLPYMINEGKYSYFSKIITKEIDKIINIPILKNAGSSITLCLKNLAYGAVSNTGRLHKELWAETSAEVCAFPPLRDKVVLNIVDGVKGCYNGGPGANPQFFNYFNTILLGTDPVAVDRIGYEIILKKRIDEKIQKQESAKGRLFLELAQNLNLGIADLNKIDLIKI